MSTRIKPGMVIPLDEIVTSDHGTPLTIVRFHKGGICPEVSRSVDYGPGWVCKYPDGRLRIVARRFLAVNRYNEKGSGPPDPHRNDWYYRMGGK